MIRFHRSGKLAWPLLKRSAGVCLAGQTQPVRQRTPMTFRFVSSSVTLRAAAVGTGSLALAVALTVPASAAEPAGTGVQINAASTSGSTLSWSGSYSCTGGLAETITVTATDTTGH